MRPGPPPACPHVRVLVRPDEEQALVVLRGEVDVAAAAPLSQVRQWLDEQHLDAVVDASRVAFLDCAGWSAVCSLAPAGSEPLVRRPSSAVRRLLAALAVAGGSRSGPGVPMQGHRAPRG